MGNFTQLHNSQLANSKMSSYSIIFINSSNIPVNVETWQSYKPGFSKLKENLINPNETVTIPSDNGEWYVDTFIYDSILCKQVVDAGYNVAMQIGKFRDSPCAQGDYSWLIDDRFQLIFHNGTMTLSN